MRIMCVWPLSLERVKAVVLSNCGGLQAIETIENQSRGGEREKGIDFQHEFELTVMHFYKRQHKRV